MSYLIDYKSEPDKHGFNLVSHLTAATKNYENI